MGLLQRACWWLDRNGWFDRLSDELYLKIMFWSRMDKRLNLKAPETFNEKLQWLKLYDRKPEYTTMVDKYEAKKYAAEHIGQEHIIPTLGVWDSADQIDFDALPDRFVLKTTHDCGGLVICRDKSKLDVEAARQKMEKHMQRDYFLRGREWPYKNVKPRIIAEKFMQDQQQTNSLRDNKFYCFNGEPKFLYISEGLEDHSTASISFLNLDWTFASFGRSDYKPFKSLPPKPKNYEQMLSFARKLSEGIPFVRVDLYEINDVVYFSELTFSPCGGTMPFDPPQWDKTLGELIELPR